MADIPTIREELDAEGRAWRAGATNIVLVVLTAVGLPSVVYFVLGRPFVVPLPQLWVGVLAYGALVVALCIPRQHYRWRATMLLSSLYVLAAEQLASKGLVGDGRIALLMIPLLALILLGVREGWFAASITAMMLAAFTFLARSGMLARWQDTRENGLRPAYWLLQGLLLLGGLIPLMVLFTRFLALQARTMLAERQARRELEEESATRRRLEGEITRLGEEERRRLGSELHDGLCQHLTAALLHCTALENQLADRHMPMSGQATRLRAIIEGSIGMAYDVSKGLCPLDLDPDPEALISALERLARHTRETAPLACDFRSQGETSIRDPQKALHLLRIAQEAVANAVKHARSRVIQVELSSAADCLTLCVQDDGVGRRHEADAEVGGMGLQLMAYRANAIGGTLTIEHPDCGGTLVTCRVPAETRTAV